MKGKVALYPPDSRAARFSPIEDLLARLHSVDAMDWVAIVIFVAALMGGLWSYVLRRP
jgi:hypothetical protein